jgi:ABC-2 type transport system permease protein
MTRSLTIARREIGSYFSSPMAYVAMTLFLLVCGMIFWRDFSPGQPVAMRTLLDWMVWLLVVVVPLLSMGLLAQEWAGGTMETMMTAPVDETEMVLGKFLGAFGFFLILLVPTLMYVVMLAAAGEPDYGPIFSGYLGIILVGALFLAVGLFCSSLTRVQLVAAVVSAAILFLITIVPWWIGSEATLQKFWRTVADAAVFSRYTDFSKGVIDTGNVVFFFVSTALFLFLTVKVLESRRWN